MSTSKIKWKIHACFTLYFKFWRSSTSNWLWKAVIYSYLIWLQVLLFLALDFTSADYISFLQTFRFIFNIFWKKISNNFFSFLTDTPKHPLHPDLNLLKRGKIFLLMLPKLLWHSLSSDFAKVSRSFSKFWKPIEMVIFAN